MSTYALAKEGIFLTWQGEGLLLGKQMAFIRLAGCSIGCPSCDTDYKVSFRMTARDIATKASELGNPSWCWITGGEPTDQPIGELVQELRRAGFHIALATAGVRKATSDGWRVHEGFATGGVDFLSVSPHSWDGLILRVGSQCNVVPGLNELELTDETAKNCEEFATKWVTPMAGSTQSLKTCISWVATHSDWRLGIQAHKIWGVS
jgi:7-carboxy-7-deazaguanine synthase